MNSQDKDNRTALLPVAGSATVTCVDLHLKAGADVNIRSKDGSVVISNTAVSGCSGKLKLWIEAGADVNATGPLQLYTK